MSAPPAIMSTLRRTLRILTPAFFATATAIVINDKFFEVISVNGVSMNPTLSPTIHETGARDYLLLRKFLPTKDLQRGDIVAFNTPHKPETLAIKRVVALEGDLITLDRRRRPSDEDRAAVEIWDAMGAAAEEAGSKRVRVPYGHVWVEGDNWRLTRDSNTYGPISRSLITGKAVCVLYPFDRFLAKPWDAFKVRTKVMEGKRVRPVAWEDL